jgi:TRAP-type C4-dicarboxylate transport system permease small subunit
MDHTENGVMERSLVSASWAKLKKVNTLCATLSGLVLLFMALSITFDVFMRYALGSPTIWITEVSTYLFLYVIYLAGAYALQQGAHIKVTFFVAFFGKRTQRIIDLITSILAIIFTTVLLWQTSEMTWSAFKGNWTSPTMLNAPYMYIHGIMVVGSFLLLLSFIASTILQFRGEETEPTGAA